MGRWGESLGNGEEGIGKRKDRLTFRHLCSGP